MSETFPPSLDSPESPPQDGLSGEGHDRLVGDQLGVMRGWLDTIRPRSGRKANRGAHVMRAPD